MSNITIHSIDELQKFVESLELSSKQVIGLSGPMGAGKTEFTKCLMKSLKAEPASSPTFSLHNRYEQGLRAVDHFDLYRIKNDEDLESSGFWDSFDQDEGLLVIEWADRLDTEVYPSGWDYLFVTIEQKQDSDQRVLKLNRIKK